MNSTIASLYRTRNVNVVPQKIIVQLRMKLRTRRTLPARTKSDSDHFAGISREKMDKRKNAPHREGRLKSSKTNIHIRLEYH
jgi:hypothetical protein